MIGIVAVAGERCEGRVDTVFDPGWVSCDNYRMLSVAFVARSAHPDFAAALRWHLAPFSHPDPEPHSFPIDLFIAETDRVANPSPYSLLIRNRLRYRDHLLANVLARALWAIHDLVPRTVQEFVVLHAGAASRDGQAVLVPARMERGKSSLILALLLNGFDYLSDELGALDPVTARALPFPKHITLEQDSLRFFPGLANRLADRNGLSAQLSQRYVRPEDVGANTGAAVPVRWLVFPTLDWNGAPRLSLIPRAEAVEQMAANCFNLYRHRDRGVLLLGRLAREAEAFRLDGGSPRERAALLAETLS
jgi:hypothetical protein